MRGWGVDDWFRPKRWEGRGLWGSPWRPREPTRADRKVAWVSLAVCFAVLTANLVLKPERPIFVGGALGIGLVQVVQLVRTRHLSRWSRRRTPSG